MEKIIVAISFLTWGLSMLMRTSFGYFVEELSLTTVQVGIANAVVSAMVCVSAIVIGSTAGRARKVFILPSVLLLVCSAAALAVAGASSYTGILISRVLLGLGCGPLFTLIMKSVETFSSRETYPQNAGMVSNGEACINTILGPVIVVFLMNHMGFRNTNYLFAVFMVILSIAWLLLSFCTAPAQEQRGFKKGWQIKSLIKNRSLMMCLLSGTLAMAACWCIYMYVPALLGKEGNLPDMQMSYVMTAMGVFMTIWMVTLPACYSALKTKKVVIAGCILGALGLGALTVSPGNWLFIGLFILFGGCASVMNLFFMAILSVECVEQGQTASALALVNGGCELLGASLGPMIAGWIAEKTDLRVSILIAAGCLLCAGIAAAGIKTKRII